MKKWFKCFFLGFFSHRLAKESSKRGYTAVFLSLVLALVFIWSGFLGAYMLPFGTQYGNSPDFKSTAHAVFANTDPAKRIEAEIENGRLRVKGGGEYAEGLLINTFASDADKQSYSVGGYDVIVDLRAADTLAEIEAYCVSNDGKETKISYAEYLTLSDVARLNFDFKIRYTGEALSLNDAAVAGYKAYLAGSGEEGKGAVAELDKELAEGKLTSDEYGRKIYELYFEAYYPEIKEYEKESKVPLLRNYYYHQYLNGGKQKYLFIFDDCMTGAFETKMGKNISFYGFYEKLDDGAVVESGAVGKAANKTVDRFIKDAYKANLSLNVYACFTSTVMLAPFLALMIMVATIMSYSIMKLKGVKSIPTLGGMLQSVGSFVWFSGVISAVLSVIGSFIVGRGLINALPPVTFFVALLIRSIVFAVYENKLYIKESEQAEQTEV